MKRARLAAAVIAIAAAICAQPAPATAALITVSPGDRIDTPNTCTIAYTYTGVNEHTYAITAGHCANGKPVRDHSSM
jgi:streptogrisin B